MTEVYEQVEELLRAKDDEEMYAVWERWGRFAASYRKGLIASGLDPEEVHSLVALWNLSLMNTLFGQARMSDDDK